MCEPELWPKFQPLCPEMRVGRKGCKANPERLSHSGAEEVAWYRGDPTKEQLVRTKIHDPETAPAAMLSSMKPILQGDFYNIRENGFSCIHDHAHVPKFQGDGSYFQPGVKAEMTKQQEQRFFKKAQHDEQNRTQMSRVLKGDFVLSSDVQKKPKKLLTQIIARNRKEASQPNSRSQSALELRAGLTPSWTDKLSPQRRLASKIVAESCDLFDLKSHTAVVDFLSKTSQENRESFDELISSICSASKKQRGNPPDRKIIAYSDTRNSMDATVMSRPGTASVMQRSERDIQRAVGAKLHKDNPDDQRISTPKFGISNLHRTRLQGHRAECTGKIGYVPTTEERIRDILKDVRDKIYMKAIGLKEGWRWFDPNGTGDVDAQALYCIAQEFGIDCTLDECIMLRSRLDVDGDGIVGFQDFTKSMYDTSIEERDFFQVTNRPCFDYANEMMTFQGHEPHERHGNSMQSTVDLLNLSGNRGGDIRSPHPKELPGPIPQHPNDTRPGTSATEVFEGGLQRTAGGDFFTLKVKPSLDPPPRPSTSSLNVTNDVQTLRKKERQVWSDAARISAYLGGQESVESIKKVLDKMRPQTSAGYVVPTEAPYDQLRLSSERTRKLRRDVTKEIKPGALPRDITAEQARQLVAQKPRAVGAEKDTRTRGQANDDSAHVVSVAPHTSGTRKSKVYKDKDGGSWFASTALNVHVPRVWPTELPTAVSNGMSSAMQPHRTGTQDIQKGLNAVVPERGGQQMMTVHT